MKNYKLATAFVTFYLIAYTVMLQIEVSFSISLFMFSISPFLVIGMAYTILKYGSYNGLDLKENDEYGYQDKTYTP